MSGFPSSTDSFTGYTAGETLLAANNAAQLNQMQAATVAIENKVGLGASTPTSGVALVGNGTGTSTWGQISLTTGISGILPVSNGGSGTSTSTGTGSNVLNTNPILNNPTTTDLVNTGGLSNTGGITNIGGIQNVNGLTTDTLTVNTSAVLPANSIIPTNLDSTAPSSWAWQSWTPTWTNLVVSGSTVTALYTQIGKTVFFRLVVVLEGGNAPSGSVSFTLPVTSQTYAGTSTLPVLGNAQYYITNGYTGPVVWIDTGHAGLTVTGVNGTWATTANISATIPASFTNGSELHAQGVYEAAS